MIKPINLRRLYVNRFRHFLATGRGEGAAWLDGSKLTMRELSLLLWNDNEILPPYLWIWFRDRLAVLERLKTNADSTSYGDFVKVFYWRAFRGVPLEAGTGWMERALVEPLPANLTA